MARQSSPTRDVAIVATTLAAVFAYYVWWWGSVGRFVRSMDGGRRLFEDFTNHYYATGASILTTGHPEADYFYTAFFGLLMAPLAQLPLNVARVIWGGVQAGSLILLIAAPMWGVMALSRAERLAYLLLCVTSVAVLHNIAWGQVSVPLTAAVLGAAALLANGRIRWAGTALSIAAAIKYYPAAFAALFLTRRDWPGVAAFLLVGALCYAAIPSALMGWESWRLFETTTQDTSAQAMREWVPRNANSQYAGHVVARLSARWHGAEFSSQQAARVDAVGLAVALSSAAGAMALIWRQRPDALPLAISLLFLAFPFVVRTSWPHYFSYLPFCQIAAFSIGVARFKRGHRWSMVSAALAVLSAAASHVVIFNVFSNYAEYNTYGMLFIANAVALVAVAGLALGSHRDAESSSPS